jgi:hypothetical protein
LTDKEKKRDQEKLSNKKTGRARKKRNGKNYFCALQCSQCQFSLSINCH